MPAVHLISRMRWLVLGAALLAVLLLSWGVFPAWNPHVPTIAIFISAVLACILVARSAARKIVKWLALVLGSVAALICAVLIAFQVAIARLPENRVALQEWLSEKAKLSIEFSRLNAGWRLYGPELAFADVTVRTPDRTRVLATARGGSVAFDVWNSLRSGRLTAGRFTLDSPQLGLIRTRDGRIQIAGQSALAEETKPIAVENLPIGSFRVRDALVRFEDEAQSGPPWSLSGVNFTLVRTPELLELQGNAVLPASLGTALEFSGRVAGALEAPDQVVSTFSLDGEGLDLAGWADALPDSWPTPDAGRGSLALTAAFLGPQLQRLTLDTQFNDVVATTPAWTLPLPIAKPLVVGGDKKDDDDESRTSRDSTTEALAAAAVELPQPVLERKDAPLRLQFERLHVVAAAERANDGWRARVDRIELQTGDERATTKDWTARAIDVEWARPNDDAFRLRIAADVIELDSIAPLLAYLPEAKPLTYVRALNVRGTVRDLEATVDKPGSSAPLAYSFAASVDNIGFDPILKIPGATGISGVAKGSEKSGEFLLDSGPLHLSIPWMFRWPLDAHAIRGQLSWKDDGEAWHILANEVQFDTEDGKGEAKLAVRVPHDGSSPYLDISAQAHTMRAAATPKYLPANHLTEEALEWLDRAFVSGRVPRGSLELHGPTREFPFRNGEGLFLVQGSVEDLTFDYQPGWTPATQLSGNVEFRNEGMHASGITARVGDLQVTEASGGFADFKTTELKIAAAAKGRVGDGLLFVQSSPIGEVIGDHFLALRGEGALETTVSLLLPITRLDDRRLSITTKLADTTVRLRNLDAPVTGLNGSLIIRQDLPVEADLNGEWLGGPVSISITPEDRTDERATLVATGRVSAGALARFVPPSVKLSGAASWSMQTQLTKNMQGRPQRFTIDSSMEGFGLDLPYPVGKSAESTRPLHVELESSRRELLARAALGRLRGLLKFTAGRDGWALERGGVRADGVLAALPDHRGLRLEGSVDRLKLDDWFALASNDASGEAGESSARGQKLSDVLRAANLRVDLLQLYGYEWPDVRGIMQTFGDEWRIDVTGQNAEGQIVIPGDFKGSRPLTIDLERLIVMRADTEEGQTAEEKNASGDPREWPSLRVHIGDMHVENHPIGGVDLMATRVPTGLRIDSLVVAQDAVRAEARGDWLIGQEGEHSSLNATITSTDVRTTLRALNYTEFLEAERAVVTAQLSWAGGFDSSFLKRASGAMTVEAQKGQLLMLQPGAGRVLGLFSVAALPRRLSLDFSDLTEKGLSFDTIHGDFELREGNAYTNNLLLRGPAAEIGIAGRTGLGSQDFDQTAVVTGNLGASLPVAGALAGGPAVGAALLFFSQVFKEPLKGIARGYYRITGTWDDPIVERVDAAEARDTTAN